MIQSELPEYDPAIAAEYGSQGFAGPDLMGIPLLEASSLIELLLRFSFNLIVCLVIIKYFYYKKSGRRDFYFTFILFSVTVFLLIFLLDSVRLEIGMALGLFAIFGIIRYRTEQVSIREMTYLFVIIGISVINGLAKSLTISEMIITNLLFVGAIAIMESSRIVKHVETKIVLCEKIELVKPEKYEELKQDLETRTGLKIIRMEIGHIDLLRDVAYIKIFYNSISNEPNSIGNITKFDKFF